MGAWPGGVSLIGRKEGDSGFISLEGAAIGGRSSGGRSEGRPVTEEEGKSVLDHRRMIYTEEKAEGRRDVAASWGTSTMPRGRVKKWKQKVQLFAHLGLINLYSRLSVYFLKISQKILLAATSLTV